MLPSRRSPSSSPEGSDSSSVPILVLGVPVAIAIGLFAAPGLLDLGEGKDHLAVGGPGRRAQCRHPYGVDALQPRPVQTARGVLVIEEVDQPALLVEVVRQAAAQLVNYVPARLPLPRP